jgi:hypothetical protein
MGGAFFFRASEVTVFSTGKEITMTYLKASVSKPVFIAAIAAATLCAAIPAQADEQYRQDRAYCMSGQASEARDLCLKEAAAAQAERQQGAHPMSHRKHTSSKPNAGSDSDSKAADSTTR